MRNANGRRLWRLIRNLPSSDSAFFGDCSLASVDNQLLGLLRLSDRASLAALGEEVPLVGSQELWAPDEPIPFVYFPTTGFISVMVTIEGSPSIEVGMIGREGMLGAQIVLGVMTGHVKAVVQGQGMAWRIASDVFRRHLTTCPSTKILLDRYVAVLMSQMTTSVSCKHCHQTGPRLARWLLMSQDRALADSFSMTQEFLSCVLGVRRVSVTMAAGHLQREGLIEYVRGHLKVVDRAGLERAACGCYRADQKDYSALSN